MSGSRSIEPSRLYFDEPCVIRAPLSASTERRQVVLAPQRPCVPFALLSWGHRPESTLHGIAVGAEPQLLQPVAASVFSSLLSYAEFERLLDRRLDGHHAVRALWRLFRYQELDLPTLNFGGTLTLDIEGPFEELVVLAKMPDWQSWDARSDEGERR